MPSLFITGASGYIGGQVLKDLVNHSRDYSIRALVRDSHASKRISEASPQVQVVHGSLDDVELVEKEAGLATVVLNLASNKHMDSVQAIHRGLSNRQSPSYWIQVSGASLLAADELASDSFQPGTASSAIFGDVDDIDKLHSLIRAHPSRAVDNYLLDVSKSSSSIKTAIVMPPIIYGPGEGPINRRSIQIPELARVTLSRGKAVKVGLGQSCWGNVHIHDLSKIMLGLANAGVNNSQDAEMWGENGIYLPSAGEISFGEISERVAQAAKEKGLITTTEVEQISAAEAAKLLPGGSVFFGTNARIRSQRSATVLGWNPVKEQLIDEIPRAVAEEASK